MINDIFTGSIKIKDKDTLEVSKPCNVSRTMLLEYKIRLEANIDCHNRQIKDDQVKLNKINELISQLDLKVK